jgi:hypothetical protein
MLAPRADFVGVATRVALAALALQLTRTAFLVFLGEGGEDLLSAPNIGNGSNVNELPGAPRNEIARTHVFVPLVCVYCIRRIEPHRVFSDSGDEEISQLLQGLR